MEEISKDDRFSNIGKDPRFKKMPRKEKKVKIDKRFKDMFTDEKFKLKYSVDKRGRPVQSTTNENFRKYYELSDSDEDDDKSDENLPDKLPEDKAEKDTVSKKKISESKEESISKNMGKADESEDETESDSESEESGLGSGPDLARGEGNVETSSEEEESEEEEEETDNLVENWADLDRDAVEASEISSRLAVCNMDWDRVKAQDIFVLLQSFAPTGGVIKSVKVYPSEFGLQRMKMEAIKGPTELTENPLPDDVEHDAEDAEGSSYHSDKLRKYQLNRLKYYYAVVECDTEDTANKIYEECDNMEYESSSNKLDLRFIPDDMEFEESPKSICTELPSNYKPSLFFTTALCQSKVDLTWDETDHDRLKVTMNPSIGKRKKGKEEIKEEDFKAYLASSSDEEAGPLDGLDLGDESSESEDEEQQINKYRNLVQSLKESEEKKKNREIEMEISWEPGLKESTEKMIKKKEKEKDLTVWEKYLEKKKDKKKKKRDESKPPEKVILSDQENSESDEQAFSDDDVPDDIKSDPFFQDSDQEQKSSIKKKKGKKKSSKKSETEEDKDLKKKTEAELSLLMMDEEKEEEDKRHFNLKNLIQEESSKKKKKKKIKKGKLESKKDEDDFKVNVSDPRFEALYTSHMYNIDPSVPEFKKTKGMQDIAQAKQKFRQQPQTLKRKSVSSDNNGGKLKTGKLNESDNPVKDSSLQKLVESVKTKTKRFKNKK